MGIKKRKIKKIVIVAKIGIYIEYNDYEYLKMNYFI